MGYHLLYTSHHISMGHGTNQETFKFALYKVFIIIIIIIIFYL